MYDKFLLIPIDRLIMISVCVVNVSATIYVNSRPELENKLFDLYSSSVLGLYSGKVLQGREDNKEKDGVNS